MSSRLGSRISAMVIVAVFTATGVLPFSGPLESHGAVDTKGVQQNPLDSKVDKDGTVLVDNNTTTGQFFDETELTREKTGTAARGNSWPTGNVSEKLSQRELKAINHTYGAVPQEMVMIGAEMAREKNGDYVARYDRSAKVINRDAQRGAVHTTNPNSLRQNFSTYDLETCQQEGMNYNSKMSYIRGDSQLVDSGSQDASLSKSVAADVNGDGKDEIVRFALDAGKNTKEKGRSVYYLELMEGRMNSRDQGKVLTRKAIEYNQDDNFKSKIGMLSPVTIDSYFQIASGDFDNDSKDEVALYNPEDREIWIYDIVFYGTALMSWVQGDSFYLKDVSQGQFNAVNITAGDCNGDGVEEVLVTYNDKSSDTVAWDKDSRLRIIGRDLNKSRYITLYDQKILMGNDNKDPLGYASVSVGDINADGIQEIVLGGYMVNLKNQSAKGEFFGKSFPYYHELAMAYMTYDNKKQAFTACQGFTVFRDDENTIRTPGVSFDDAGHHHKDDTSLLYNDGDDDSGMCHFTNTSNWTIPLQTVNLSGNNPQSYRKDQVFFGMWTYQYDPDSRGFQVYRNAGDAYGNMRNNNYSVVSANAGMFANPSDEKSDSELVQQLINRSETLAIVGVCDYDSKHGGASCWEVAAYDSSGNGNVVSRVMMQDWKDKKVYPNIVFANLDDDAIYMTPVSHQYVCSEPRVEALILSPPWYDDIVKQKSGYNVGSTSLTHSESSSKSHTTGMGLDLNASIGWDVKVVAMGVTGNFNTNLAKTTTRAKSIDLEYATEGGEDSVVMTTTPMDVYYYNATYQDPTKATGQMKSAPVILSDPATPIQKVVAIDDYFKNKKDYKEGLEKYNAYLKKMAGSSAKQEPLKELPDFADILGHVTPGDPSSYTYNNMVKTAWDNNKIKKTSSNPTNGSDKDFIHSYVESSKMTQGSGNNSVSNTITLTSETANEWEVGGSIGYKIEAGLLVKGSFDIAATSSRSESTSTATGVGYSTTLSSIPSEYAKNYGYSARMFGYLYEDKPKDHSFYVVGSYVDGTPRSLPAIVDNLKEKSNTADSITLSWEYPYIGSQKVIDNTTYDLYRLEEDYTGKTEGQWTLLKSFKASENPQREKKTRYNEDSYKPMMGEFTDQDLQADSTYEYKMVTRNEAELTPVTNSIILNGSKTADLPSHEITLSSEKYGTMIATETNNKGYYKEVQSGAKVKEKSCLTVAAIPKGDYEVIGWNVTDSSGEEISSDEYTVSSDKNTLKVISVKQPLNIKPVYRQITYSVKVSVSPASQDRGTVYALYTDDDGNDVKIEADSAVRIPKNKNVTFYAQPQDAGYGIKSWQINEKIATSRESSYTVKITENTEIMVSFQKTKYKTLAVNSSILPVPDGEEDQYPDTLVNNSQITVIAEDDVNQTIIASGENHYDALNISSGNDVAIKAVPASATEIKQWIVDGNIYKKNGTEYTGKILEIDDMRSDRSVEVKYAPVKGHKDKVSFAGVLGKTEVDHVLTATSSGAEIESGSSVQEGADVTINANVQTAKTKFPDANIVGVKKWYVDGQPMDLEGDKYTRKDGDGDLKAIAVWETAPVPADETTVDFKLMPGQTVTLDAQDLAEDVDLDPLFLESYNEDNRTDLLSFTESEDNEKLFVRMGDKEGVAEASVKVKDPQGNSIWVKAKFTIESGATVKTADTVKADFPSKVPGDVGMIAVNLTGYDFTAADKVKAVLKKGDSKESQTEVINGTDEGFTFSRNALSLLLDVPQNTSGSMADYKIEIEVTPKQGAPFTIDAGTLSVESGESEGILGSKQETMDIGNLKDLSVKIASMGQADKLMISNGSILENGKDYTIQGDQITIKQSYFEHLSLEKGDVMEFVIWFISEKDDVINVQPKEITVTDSSNKIDTAFTGGDSTVKGTAPERMPREKGQSIVLPANPYEKEGYLFDGWKNAKDGKVYDARTIYTVDGMEDVAFTAQWSDTVRPGVTISVNGKTYREDGHYGAPLTLDQPGKMTIDVSDNSNKVKVFYMIHAASQKPKAGDPGWITYEKPVTFDKEGTHYISVKAVDDTGNTTIFSTGKIITDSASPEITMAYKDSKGSDASGKWTSDSKASVHIHAQDNSSEISQLTFLMADTLTRDRKAATEKTVQISPVKNGNYHLMVSAWDNAGNSTRQIVAVKKDAVTPKLEIAAAASSQEGKTLLKLKETVGASGVKSVQIAKFGQPWEDITKTYHEGYQADQKGHYTVIITNKLGRSSTSAITLPLKDINKAKIVTASTRTYTGKAQQPSISVKYGSTTLKKNTDYTVAYADNINIGTAVITVKGKGNYTGTAKARFTIIPKKTAVTSISNSKKGQAVVKFQKVAPVSGYQITRAQDKKFSKGRISKTTAKTSYTMTKLKKGNVYYVKVRSYKIVSGKKVYGAYSGVKAIEIKK